MINVKKPAAFVCIFTMLPMDPALQSLEFQSAVPSITPRTLLLPGNEEIQVPDPKPLILPSILPPIVKPPHTPRTPRRRLTIQELLQSLI